MFFNESVHVDHFDFTSITEYQPPSSIVYLRYQLRLLMDVIGTVHLSGLFAMSQALNFAVQYYIFADLPTVLIDITIFIDRAAQCRKKQSDLDIRFQANSTRGDANIMSLTDTGISRAWDYLNDQ